MNPIDAITSAEAALVIAPPATPDELEELEGELAVRFPDELRTLLAHAARIDGGGVGTIDFTGRAMDYEDRDLFPAGLPIAGDGAGNFWVLDLVPAERERATMFFASHDPPVAVRESDGLGSWLERVLRPSPSPIELASRPPLLDRGAALAADDELRAFAATLDERFVFADLRAATPGRGFEWGRYGPRTEVRRHGFARLWALAPPERRPGLMQRRLRR
ncbi:MAG: SMI1/KNR4 family protein [Gaiellaceae bacterium]